MFENPSSNQYYLQTSNIDFLDSNGNSLNISNNNYRFSGTYDGNGLSIKNYSGANALFPENWGIIKNVGLVNVNVQSDSIEAGPLVGVNVGYITSCYAAGAIAGKYYVGGLVGYNYANATVQSCYFAAAMMNNIDRFAGIAAVNEKGSLIDVFSAVTSIQGETDYYPAAILYAPYTIR
jgi:hypothetical protein